MHFPRGWHPSQALVRAPAGRSSMRNPSTGAHGRPRPRQARARRPKEREPRCLAARGLPPCRTAARRARAAAPARRPPASGRSLRPHPPPRRPAPAPAAAAGRPARARPAELAGSAACPGRDRAALPAPQAAGTTNFLFGRQHKCPQYRRKQLWPCAVSCYGLNLRSDALAPHACRAVLWRATATALRLRRQGRDSMGRARMLMCSSTNAGSTVASGAAAASAGTHAARREPRARFSRP